MIMALGGRERRVVFKLHSGHRTPNGAILDRDVLPLFSIYSLGKVPAPLTHHPSLRAVQINDHIVGIDGNGIA